MKKTVVAVVFLITTIVSVNLIAIENFSIRTLDKSEVYTFVKVFSEIRGPLRVEMLKNSKSNFEEMDPLNYLTKVKDDKDVQKILTEKKLTWDDFMGLSGNILLAYFSIQPNRTKVSLIRQLSGYGIGLSNQDIPPEYQAMIEQVIKTEEGAAMASVALDMFLKIPPENIDLAKKNQRKLDQLFYTKFWKDKI